MCVYNVMYVPTSQINTVRFTVMYRYLKTIMKRSNHRVKNFHLDGN